MLARGLVVERLSSVALGVALGLASTRPLVGQELIRVVEPIPIRPPWSDLIGPDPRVGVNPVDGSFMAVWPEGSPPSSVATIQSRRFSLSGQTLDPGPVQVNTITAGFEGYPRAAANERGEFLVVWAGRPNESEFFFDVFGQRFDRDGNRLGGQVTLNSVAPGPPGATNPTVAMAPHGDFVVGWDRYTFTAYEIGFRPFDSVGAPLQPETQANVYTTDNQGFSGTAIDPRNGTSLVAWTSQGQYSGPDPACTPAPPGFALRGDIIARRYDAQGLPQGGEILVSVPRPWGLRRQSPAVAALGDGEFVVAWLDTRPTCYQAPPVIKGRIVAANGSLGGELPLSDAPVSAVSLNGFNSPRLAADGAGGFLASWYEDGRGYVARRFDRSGLRVGSDTILIPPPEAGRYVGGFGMGRDSSGNVVVVWDSTLDELNGSYTHQLYTQVFAPQAAATPVGEGVPARPIDENTRTFPVQLTFEQVTVAGATSVTSNMGPLPPPPSGYAPGAPPIHYDITTTAAFDGSVVVCIDYGAAVFTDTPALFHLENGEWVDRTLSPVDTANHTICASVTSLSPFGIFQRSDGIPPTTSALASPPPNSAGWNNSHVTVTLTALDDPGGSGVQQITYSASGAQVIGSTSVSGDSTSVVVVAEGETVITFFATDNAGNVETAKTIGVKLDQTGPNVRCAASPNRLWPPDHVMVPVRVSVAVTDSLSGAGRYILLSAMSNEADNGLGDGDFPRDIQGFDVGSADTSGQLRAERSGTGSGRVYALTYRGWDLAGNTHDCRAVVTVPK